MVFQLYTSDHNEFIAAKPMPNLFGNAEHTLKSIKTSSTLEYGNICLIILNVNTVKAVYCKGAKDYG